ncbi:MAG: hypothetical protein HRU13_02240 [Phycisphaerales bacterium]|nr:hypothetical protein [Phycisphaerales bacterium]
MGELSANRFNTLLASEATYGTDEVQLILQDPTRSIIYQDLRSVDVVNTLEIFAPERVRGSASGVRHKPFKDLAGVSIEFPLTGRAGSGAGEEAPFYAPLLAASNMREVVVASTSATYNPATVNQAGMTVYKFVRDLEDDVWRLQIATGVRGNTVFNFEINAEAYGTFTGTGRYNGLISDTAAWFAPGIQFLKDGTTAVAARTPPATETQVDKTLMGCRGMTVVTYGGVSLPIATMELDLAFSTDLVRTVQADTSVKKAINTRAGGTRVGGSFDLQDGSAAMEALRDAMEAGSEAALEAVLTDGTDTITVTMDNVQIGMWSEGANGNVRTYSVPFFANGDWSQLGADNDLRFVYT